MIKWGTVGEWVAGIGAVIAVAATVYLARRDRRREDERVRLARSMAVTVWVEEDRPIVTSKGREIATILVVANNGVEPVTAWVAGYYKDIAQEFQSPLVSYMDVGPLSPGRRVEWVL